MGLVAFRRFSGRQYSSHVMIIRVILPITIVAV